MEGKRMMARPRSEHPTDGEIEILRILWDMGPATLGQVCQELRRDRNVATTTVATMLRVMRGKKLVRRRQGKQGYSWSATISHEDTAQRLVGKLIDRVFDGSAQRLVTHLVDTGDLTAIELQELKELLDTKQPRSGKKKDTRIT